MLPLMVIAGGSKLVVGGDVYRSGGYVYHKFTSTDTLRVLGGDINAE